MADPKDTRISEKRYYHIQPMQLTANSTSDGLISVESTYGIKVNQILLFKSSVQDKLAKVQRVISETQFIVIDAKEPVTTKNKLDMSIFSLINLSTVELAEEKRPVIDILEIQRQVYEEEPTVANRLHLVDWLGRSYDASNPMPIGGNLNIQGSLPGISPDAFARTRVSEPFTLGDYKHLYSIDSNFYDKTLNGGTITFNQNKASATLATSSDVSSLALHQTKFYHHYQPGKSQLVLSSIYFGFAQRNVTKRTGYYDDRDGIYFEQVGSNTSDGTDKGQLNWVIRSFAGGFADESSIGDYHRRVPQDEWNLDKCDGSGPSKFNIDPSKTQLIWMDFQWLGVGRVRCGFVHDGNFIVAHEYYHSNVLPEVYISNPNLPIRCEILNTGETSGGSMEQICSSVSSEGGYVESGVDVSVSSPLRTTSTVGGTRLPLIAIRLKNSFNGYPNRISVKPNQISIFATTESVMYEVIKLPSASNLSTTLNGGVLQWTSAGNSSGVEYCVNATSISAANIEPLTGGYISAGSSQNSLSSVSSGSLTSAKKNVIHQNIDSTDSEVYVLSIKTISTGNNVQANATCVIQWREIY